MTPDEADRPPVLQGMTMAEAGAASLRYARAGVPWRDLTRRWRNPFLGGPANEAANQPPPESGDEGPGGSCPPADLQQPDADTPGWRLLPSPSTAEALAARVITESFLATVQSYPVGSGMLGATPRDIGADAARALAALGLLTAAPAVPDGIVLVISEGAAGIPPTGDEPT